MRLPVQCPDGFCVAVLLENCTFRQFLLLGHRLLVEMVLSLALQLKSGSEYDLFIIAKVFRWLKVKNVIIKDYRVIFHCYCLYVGRDLICPYYQYIRFIESTCNWQFIQLYNFDFVQSLSCNKLSFEKLGLMLHLSNRRCYI